MAYMISEAYIQVNANPILSFLKGSEMAQIILARIFSFVNT
jgi:hypothetical protein